MQASAMAVEVSAAWISDIGPIVAGIVGGALVAWLGFRASRNDRRRERQEAIYDKVLNRATWRREQRKEEKAKLSQLTSQNAPGFMEKLSTSFHPERTWYAVEARFRAFAPRKVIGTYDAVIHANKELTSTAAAHIHEFPIANEVSSALDKAIKADDDLISAISGAYEHRWRVRTAVWFKAKLDC